MICKHFGKCGGCQLQNLSYEDQIKLKKNSIELYFKREIDKIIPSPKPIYYRNRMDYVIGEEDNKIIVGLKEKGKWWKIVDLKECFLMSEEADKIKNLFRDFANKNKLTAWNLKKHKGLLRYLIIREGKFTNERMVIINTSNDYLNKGFKENKKEKLSEKEIKAKSELENKFTEFLEILKNEKIRVDSFIHGVNNTITDISYNFEINLLEGDKYIKEKLNNFYFLIGPNSFFQSNSYTTDLMIKEVKYFIEETNKDFLIDLYCGEGTFSLPFHDFFEKIYGIELNRESIELYNKNIELNKIDKEKFNLRAISVEKSLKNEDFKKLFNENSLLIVDPPRSGLNEKVVKFIKNSKINEMIYISCNFKTQYRDIVKLGFKVKNLIMIDQFPQTNHVETITFLKRQ